MRLGLTVTAPALVLLALGCGQSATNDGAGLATGGTGGTVASVGGSSSTSGSAGAPVTSGGSGVATGGGGAAAQAGSGGSAVAVGGMAGGGGTGGTAVAGGSAGAAGSGGGGQANPEGVPADYKLLIDETFADAASLAKLKFANPTEWVHQDTDGGYIESTGSSAYAPPYYSPHSLAIFKDQKFGAFVMEAEVIQTNVSGGHRDFCFFWGMESPSRYYYAHIGEAHDGASHNIHIVLDAGRTAITKTFTAGFDWGMDVWRKIRITRSAAGDMAVYGNGDAMPMLTATDTRLGSGYVGFGSFDDKGKVRNFKLWAPSSEMAPAAFFTAK
jgi:hypothetical protein